MESTLEKRRFFARCVAVLEMIWLVIVTIAYIPFGCFGIFLAVVAHNTQAGVIASFLLIFVILGVELCAASMLLEGSLGFSRFWYYLNILMLIIGVAACVYFVPIVLYTPTLVELVVGSVIIFIRVYMLLIVKLYINVLNERVSERINIELQAVYARSSALAGNETQSDYDYSLSLTDVLT